jgi:exodeoxyribonuclease III
MRVATWNVNGLRARLPFVLHWLRARRPDLVALQELKLLDEQFPHAELQAEGYHALTHGQKAWNGVAILSREPLEVVQCGLPGQDAVGARVLTARLGELRFTSLYCPNGKTTAHPEFAQKLLWFDALVEHLQSCEKPDRPSILGGDFNVCATALDSWNEEALHGRIFHTDEERERVARLFGLGFLDLFRARSPQLRAFSWWDYRAGDFHQNRGLRIDLLLGTPPVVDRLESVEIDREYRKKKDGETPSDHAPVFADVELP